MQLSLLDHALFIRNVCNLLQVSKLIRWEETVLGFGNLLLGECKTEIIRGQKMS